MNHAELRAYCASKPGAEQDYPFGPDTLVFKVMNKLFALTQHQVAANETASVNLKCEPGLAQILRQTYPAVQPGYHMNKKHWNTVILDGTIPDDEICEMIDNSYRLVVSKLKKADRERLLGPDEA
jgi:predicted DNA-binding protein (MmcQ/YjbR family)